jgi:UDP-N-acetylglucosamine 1-carboxyvinyltransferase
LSSYIIKGGHPLYGEVTVSGSKNAALGIIAASMVLDGPCVIDNVPHIMDVGVLLDICRVLGATVDEIDEHTIRIDPTTVVSKEATTEKTRHIRASYYLLGALLARFNEVKLNMPGGCNFGTRPIDLHLKGFHSMGASHELVDGVIHLKADKLTGGHLYMNQASVGATINVMIAATKANGSTVIENAAREPHIVDVANFLNIMGANIKGAGTDTIRITGVPKLPGYKTYSIIPDQIEAGTFMVAAAAARGDVVVRNLIPKHMEPLTQKMREMGVTMEEGGDWIRVLAKPEKELNPTTFKTRPYPGFPTDLQPQVTILLCTATGNSQMHENVWENRFQYIDELKRMNVDISIAGSVALVMGPQQMTSARVKALDLRAGAAMVIAATIVDGVSEIYDVHMIERGYENIVEKLRGIGVDITTKD